MFEYLLHLPGIYYVAVFIAVVGIVITWLGPILMEVPESFSVKNRITITIFFVIGITAVIAVAMLRDYFPKMPF